MTNKSELSSWTQNNPITARIVAFVLIILAPAIILMAGIVDGSKEAWKTIKIEALFYKKKFVPTLVMIFTRWK